MQRKSERELVVTRVFNGPPRVFEVWTRRELLKRFPIDRTKKISNKIQSRESIPDGMVDREN